jgi:hypothetical protein
LVIELTRCCAVLLISLLLADAQSPYWASQFTYNPRSLIKSTRINSLHAAMSAPLAGYVALRIQSTQRSRYLQDKRLKISTSNTLRQAIK